MAINGLITHLFIWLLCLLQSFQQYLDESRYNAFSNSDSKGVWRQVSLVCNEEDEMLATVHTTSRNITKVSNVDVYY